MAISLRGSYHGDRMGPGLHPCRKKRSSDLFHMLGFQSSPDLPSLPFPRKGPEQERGPLRKDPFHGPDLFGGRKQGKMISGGNVPGPILLALRGRKGWKMDITGMIRKGGGSSGPRRNTPNEDYGGSRTRPEPAKPQGGLPGSLEVSRTVLARLLRGPHGPLAFRAIDAKETGLMGEGAHASSPIVILDVFS